MNKNLLTNRIYSNQKANSKRRGHNPPNYTLKKLREWMYAQPNFEELYDNWVESDYEKMLVPSCDRTNDALGYDLNRLQLMTWQENKNKGHKGVRKGKLNSIIPHKGVVQFSLDGKEINSYISTREAERQTTIRHSDISLACKGYRIIKGKKKKAYTAGGFKWKYIN